MINIPILPLLILVPLIGVIFVLLSVEDDEYSFQSKKSALWTSIINFLLSLYLPFNFDKITCSKNLIVIFCIFILKHYGPFLVQKLLFYQNYNYKLKVDLFTYRLIY